MERESTPTPTDIIVEENWASFKARLGVFSEKWRGKIEFAYDLAKDIHRPQFRKDGTTPFFDHPRGAAIILLDEVGVKAPTIIIAALLHDAVEDSVVFGNYDGVAYNEWIRMARSRITPYFGERVANLVIALTKPKVDGKEIKDKEQAMEIYFRNLSSNPDALLIKMADRLHNLRDIKGLTIEEKKKLVEETRERYFGLFENAKQRYPKETEYLLSKMLEAIDKIEKNH